MKQNCRNIYFNARATAGYTQERWAEMIGVSTEAVRQYESGKILPSDDVATRMAETAGLLILGYWHLREKSRAAATLLPELRHLSLAQATVQMIARVREYSQKHTEDTLLQIAEDGTVSPEEQPAFEAVLADLEGIVQAALQLRYAERGDMENEKE